MSLLPELHASLRAVVTEGRIARQRPTRHKRRIAVGSGVAFLATGTALAASGIWSPTVGTKAHGFVTVATSPAPRALTRSVAVLRRQQADADRGADVDAALRQLSSAGLAGIHLSDLRLLGRHEGGVALLVPVDRSNPDAAGFDAHDQLCLIYTTTTAASQYCRTPTQLMAGELSGVNVRSHDGFVSGLTASHVFGVVPDGVAAVEVELQDGSILREAVANNFYDAQTNSIAAPRLITWFASNGAPIRRIHP